MDGQGRRLCLGIETSCDETAAAVVADGTSALSDVVASQAELHRRYGGVVPELAARRHLEAVLPAVLTALEEAGVGWDDLDLVAVTRGPGLPAALLVGVAAAKALAYARGLPLVGVNHLAGHLLAYRLEGRAPRWPAVGLVVSGSHTDLCLLPSEGRLELLGSTSDDAAGEAFDKVARLLGLGYPGGPAIDRLARRGDPEAVRFPRALERSGDYRFSFSGLKTAVAVYLERHPDASRADVAASFQAAVVDVLAGKALQAAAEHGARSLIVCGGVAANSALRERLAAEAGARGLDLVIPAPRLCTDNAAMIAAAGDFAWLAGRRDGWDLEADPDLPLGLR